MAGIGIILTAALLSDGADIQRYKFSQFAGAGGLRDDPSAGKQGRVSGPSPGYHPRRRYTPRLRRSARLVMSG